MAIFEPLFDLVSWIILTLHTGFDKLGMTSSFSWCLAIVGLVVIIRILLIPLFVRQIKSMRAMQQLQPEIRKVQQRYKGDRERTSQELMKLYKEHNTNPLASCFPILAQAPIFFALYYVLNAISKSPPQGKGVLDSADVESAASAQFFGVGLGEKFLGAESFHVQAVTIVMILAMTGSQFFTQKQLMTKNMPAAAMETNPFMQQQKVMLYLFPIMFAVFGVNFPVGVLLYWLVSNFWSMGQQIYVIRRMPAVGSPAYEAMMARREKKNPGSSKVELTKATKEPDAPSVKPTAPVRPPKGGKAAPAAGANGAARTGGGRAQPQRQTRSKRAGTKKR